MPQFPRKALIGVLAGQRLGSQTITLKHINPSTIFPVLLLLGNIASAIGYALSGEWKKALYWAASSVCIGSITF